MSSDDHVHTALDRALSDVRAPLDRTLRALAETIAGEERASDRRLSRALRSLSEAQSLGEVLNLLVDCAGREVGRSAVLIVAAGRLKGWRWDGFDMAAIDAKTVDLPLDHSGLIATAVRTQATIVSPATDARPSTEALPVFALNAGPRDAAAMPIVLGGAVAAVLYVDAPPTSGGPPSWVDAVGILTNCAGVQIEAMTARYLTGVSSVSASRSVAREDHATSGGAR